MNQSSTDVKPRQWTSIYLSIITFRHFEVLFFFKDITISRIRDFISSSINVIMSRIRDFISCSSFRYRFSLFLNRKTFEVRNKSILFLNIEFFSSTMNDDKIFFKIIMLIFNSNNFHLWIEEFKDLILKTKIWKYINSYNQIAKSRKEILFEIFHYVVKAFAFASSTVADDLITIQIDQSVQAS
jgi:hypothetical protein